MTTQALVSFNENFDLSTVANSYTTLKGLFKDLCGLDDRYKFESTENGVTRVVLENGDFVRRLTLIDDLECGVAVLYRARCGGEITASQSLDILPNEKIEDTQLGRLIKRFLMGS